MPRIAKEKTIKKEENISIKEKENEKTSPRKKENNISTSTKKNTKNTTVTKVNKQEKILEKNKLNTISNENETSSKSKTSIKTSSKKIASNKPENKKTTSNKNSSTKATAKKETSVKVDTKKSTSPKKETSIKVNAKKSTASKKETSIKANAKKSIAPKKETSIKAGTKKSTVSNKTASTKSKKASNLLNSEIKSNVKILEYYDLPYKYGHTLIKLLAQTPKTLFVYWEISDIDVENFKNNYGEDFFKITKPILIIHNLTLNETYEVEINDFANCWYLDITHPDCKYDVELARKFIKNNKDNKVNDYLYITKSNDLISPNNHILFEKLGQFVTFRNVNTNEKITSNIKSYDFLSNIYEFYKQMYNEELLNNPSSNFI